MKAVTFHGAETVRCEDAPDPRIEDGRDALMKVSVAAICGSDLHPYHGREQGLDAGTVMGHECVGEVIEVGSDCSGLAVGTRVVLPFTTSCGRCAFCLEGLTARCVEGELFGWREGGRGLHGGQAELLRVPLAASTLVAVPPGIDDESALFVGDVLATGFHGALLAGCEDKGVAAVVGCGPVGLMAVVAARELGAARVFAVDSVHERLELARSYGAEPLDLAQDPVAALLRATDGMGAASVIEAVGSPSASRMAFDLARPGGAIAAVGVHNEPHLAVSPGELYDKNLTYRAGRCPARAYADRVLELIRSGGVDPARVVSHRMPFSEAARGYEIFAGREDGCTKVLLTPD